MKVKDLYFTLASVYTMRNPKIEVRTKGSETVETEWAKLVEEYGEWYVYWYNPSIRVITIVKEEAELFRTFMDMR